MLALDRSKPIECDKCGKRFVKKNISHHNKSSMRGSLFRGRPRKNWITTKQKRRQKTSQALSACYHSSFYAVCNHKQTLHGSQSQSNVKLSETVDIDTIMGDRANQQLREELRNVERFLVDSESI